MERLGESDLRRVLGFLTEATFVESEEPFSPECLEALGRLIPCDHLNFSQQDRIHRKTLGFTMFPVCDEDDEEDEDFDTAWRLHDQHPICHHQDVAGDFRAYRLSDLVSKSEWQRRELYVDYYGPDGLDYQMCVGFDGPPSHTKAFVFSRHGGRDFSERDRRVANALRPHLARLYEASEVKRRLRQALTLHERSQAAVVLIDRDDRIEFANPAACDLLERAFGEFEGFLPTQLRVTLPEGGKTGHPEPARIAVGETCIVMHRVGEALLLEEEPNLPNLTRREREILDLVAEGRTNAEIATVLWLAPGTVRRHLENVFRKLGVHTRTAAVARLRQGRPATR
jgi:DNA-binding CsgD family transcriptional regulator